MPQRAHHYSKEPTANYIHQFGSWQRGMHANGFTLAPPGARQYCYPQRCWWRILQNVINIRNIADPLRSLEAEARPEDLNGLRLDFDSVAYLLFASSHLERVKTLLSPPSRVSPYSLMLWRAPRWQALT